MEMVARSKHARLVLTTREHILQHAFQISERFQRQKSELAQKRCILELGSYSLLERARILYNHIYFSDLPSPYRSRLLADEFYLTILKHRNFNPRLVEWLSRFTNVRSLPPQNYQAEVRRVLEDPAQLWRIAFEQQISEASRSLLLALYSLGGGARLDHLQVAWKALHHYRASKYHFRVTPEDWRRSLQDLEGGFLKIDARAGSVSFVNPSVKDFLDGALVSDTEHVDDLLSTSAMFKQIVSVWSLAISEKGRCLLERFEKFPDQLLEVAYRILECPHLEKAQGKEGRIFTRRRDVGPEIRLRTLISFASRVRSRAVLEKAVIYAKEVIGLWATKAVDFNEAIEILALLEAEQWPPLEQAGLFNTLKDAILENLSHAPGSQDLEAVAKYAGGTDRWTVEDRKILGNAFLEYVKCSLAQDIENCTSEGELEDTRFVLGIIAEACDIGESVFLYKIESRLQDIKHDDDDDDHPVQHWEGRTSGLLSEPTQDAEIRRLFEGL